MIVKFLRRNALDIMFYTWVTAQIETGRTIPSAIVAFADFYGIKNFNLESERRRYYFIQAEYKEYLQA